MGRPLSQQERAVVLRMIELSPTERRESLRSAQAVATANPGCACGCGSFDLEYSGEAARPRGSVVAKGFVHREPLTPIGVLLWVSGDRPQGIEFYDMERRDGDAPLPFPEAGRIRPK